MSGQIFSIEKEKVEKRKSEESTERYTVKKNDVLSQSEQSGKTYIIKKEKKRGD